MSFPSPLPKPQGRGGGRGPPGEEAHCGGLPSVTDRANDVDDLPVPRKCIAPVSQLVGSVRLEVDQQVRVRS